MQQGFDIEAFNALSPEEQKIAMQMLEDLSKGDSTIYDSLISADYKETPADIMTFIHDRKYLGNAWHTAEGKCKLFPYWEGVLTKLFPDPYTTSVNNLIESGARGLGKSEIATTCMLYLMHRLMCLKDPHTYYNIKVTEKFAFAFMNITKDLAESIGISKFQDTVQMSPWFMERGTITGINTKIWNPPDFIDIIIGSQPKHTIGRPIFGCFFDEISFINNKDIEKQKEKAMDMLDTAVGGMRTRFTNHGKNPGLVILASSKRSDKSFLEEHMKKSLENNPDNVIIVDEPVWNIRPASEYSGRRFNVALGNKFLASQVIPDSDKDLDYWRGKGYNILEVPVEYKDKFLEDIDRALCDYAGISSSELTKYINGERWEAIKTPEIKNLFTRDVIEVGNDPNDTQQYFDYIDMSNLDRSMLGKPLFIHLDMSISGDKTGIAGVWIKGKKPLAPGEPDSNSLLYQVAFSVSIKAPKGRQVSFAKHRQFILWLREQGFNIKQVTADTFQSYDTLQELKSRGFATDTLSVDRVENISRICKPYQYFKTAIYEGRLIVYKEGSALLSEEVTNLERNANSGKVDHPDNGRFGSKDQADAVCLHPDTEIYLLSGKHKTIKQLYEERDNLTDWVLSYNTISNKFEPVKIKDVVNNGIKNNLVKLTLDTGETLICTEDHLILTRDGKYIEAKDTLNQSLMPFSYEDKEMREARVVKLEKVEEASEVYDLKLDSIHNFALTCGLVVHNCGALWTASQHAEEYAYNYSDSVDTFTSFNLYGSSDILTDTDAFENSLKEIYRQSNMSSMQQPNNGRKANDMLSDVYGNNGILII